MENQMFHVTVWKDQAVDAPERMEDNIVVRVSDEGVCGEQSEFCLNENSENMETSDREVDSLGTEGPDNDMHPEEEMFEEGAVVSGEAFEILIINGVTVDDDNKGSRTVQCFDINDDLDEKYVKELSNTLKIPDFETLGKNETLHNMRSCLEVQCPEESVTLQEARLTGLDAVKTEFHLNSDGTRMKELLTQMDFSGTLSHSWEQGTYSRLPIITDLEEEKELCSFHMTTCNEQVSGKRVGETHANDCVSNEEQSEQSAVNLKVINQNKLSSESEVRVSGEGSSYSRCPCIREIKAKETDFRDELIVAGVPSKTPKQNCDSDERDSRTIQIKHCYVVLKDLRDELNEKYEDSLRSLNTEIQSLKMQNERKASFSGPSQVSLHDVLDENDVKKESTVIKNIEAHDVLDENDVKKESTVIKNIKAHDVLDENDVKKESTIIKNIRALVENEKLNNMEKKVIKSPGVLTSRGPNNTDVEIHHNSAGSKIKGPLIEIDSPDLSVMVEEGIFSRLSLMEEECKSSSISLFQVEEEDQRARTLQSDSCLLSRMTSEVQKPKRRKVAPGAMFMKHWNKPVEQLGREEMSSSSSATNPNRKGFNSRFSGGLFASNISQVSTIILAPGTALQTEDIQGIPVEGTSTCLSVNKTGNVLGEGKSHNTLPLLPDDEYDVCVTVREPSCIPLPAVEKLETNQKGKLLSPMKNQMPKVEGLVQYSLVASAEEISQGQLIVEEQKSLNGRHFKSSNKNDDNTWFLMEVAEDFDNVNVVNVTDGQNKAVQPETGGEHLNSSKVTLQLQNMEMPASLRNMAECHSRMADVKKINDSDVKKSTALRCLEQDRDGHIGCVEKKMNPEPAKETCHVGKMSGPVVRLLGVSSKACKPTKLKRLVELEDSSDDEAYVCCQSTQKMSRPVLGVSGSKTCKPCKMQRVEELEDLSDDIFADLQQHQEIKDSDYHPTRYKKEMKRLLKPYAAHVLWEKPLNSYDSSVKKRRGRRATSKEPSPSASIHSPQLSKEQSRIKVRNSLHGMLQKRLEESPDLDVHADTILRLASNLEKEIFNLFLCVDHRYKNKYRSLLFNLKAPKNKLLFHQVVLGEVSPQCLVQMNSLEMAPKELAEWRAKESKHVLEVIEKQQREAPKCRPIKLTHKGEIEIHREVDDNFTLEDLYGSALYMDKKPSSQHAAKSERDTTDQHRSHLLDPDCLICTGRMAPDGERGFNPPQIKSASKKKSSNSSTRLLSTTVYSDKGRKHLEKDRPASTGILKKNPKLQKQTKDTVLWEGLIQMFSIKQFVAKAYPVSGYGSRLIQALPELIQSKGCILPEDVWDYLDSIWPGEAKEMSVIQFYPAMTKDFSTYNMLYSYLNSKQRYGIVDSSQMEMFMVPLPAFQPVPARFHLLGGPGLDSHHSCLLLGLILPKKVSGSSSANSMGLSLLKETKRKTVTFKNNPVTKRFSPPLHSSESTKLAESSQQEPSMAFTGKWLSRNEYPPPVSHSQEPLTKNMFALRMSADEVLNGWTSHGTSSHYQTREEESNQSVQNFAFQSLSNLFSMGGQSHGMAEESLGKQQNTMGGHVEFQAAAGPATSQNWNFGALSSLSLCSPEYGGSVALSANMLDIQQLSSLLYPGVTFSGGPQVPSLSNLVSYESSATSDLQNHAAVGDANPTLPMEGALPLIQYLEALVQLNAQIQNQILFSFPSLNLPATQQATTPEETQIVGEATFPPILQESGVYPKSQLTLPPFSGPVYPPSGC